MELLCALALVGHGEEKISCRKSSRAETPRRREDFLPWELSRRDAETQRNSFFKPVGTSSNTGFHHRYHHPDSFSVILCASARDLFLSNPGKEVSGLTLRCTGFRQHSPEWRGNNPEM